ncbi:P-loop NTPase fold protein [Pantoea agglomerans]|uniref:P-loop NTPase fold protein n=1 Tax=Enterobacter agglomerans TaxID=549 RepID=UPI0005809CC1|nr:P-loop NTPase fold protein [Pantoea agglomerans]KIC86278.1 hypothetical protein RN49_15815 [Pantoea agglomerans]MBA5703242.1 hypothetical protein [Pantoea agglomerans]SUB04305.1 Uncharacterised protein [Pantoea agglomerans]
MSLKVIREQVLKFVSQSTPSVIAIKGEWGVGKTYGWEALLQEAKSGGMITAKRYSYVSLFGISSLDKLKYTIFENSIQQDSIGHDPNLESLRTNTFGMLEILGRGSWSKLKDMPFVKSAAPAIEAFSFMSVTDSLICIDDLERKGSGLDLKDVLGLVSLLKEKKKCKVVLLLNAGTEETVDYEKYKEKVIDIELEFSPTPEESAQVAYDGSKSYHSELSKFTVSLGIKNIRVLTKIEKYIDIVLDFFEKTEPELTRQLLHTASLFSWAYYCSNHDSDIPTLDFIESPVSRQYSSSNDLSDKQKLWKNLLLSYEFTNFDKLDSMIAKLVRSGYVDRDALKEVVAVSNKKIIEDKNNNGYQRAWDTFHNSFDDNQQLVVQQLYDNFLLNIRQLGTSDLDGLVSVLRDLDSGSKATELIDAFISERKGDIELFNPESFHFVRKITDAEILEKFSGIYKHEKPKRTIKDVLDKISGQNGWGNDDEEILSTSSEDEFYEYFKSINGSELTSHVSTCLKFGGFNNGSARMESIAVKTRAALKRISSESKLNEIRMKKFGL